MAKYYLFPIYFIMLDHICLNLVAWCALVTLVSAAVLITVSRNAKAEAMIAPDQ